MDNLNIATVYGNNCAGEPIMIPVMPTNWLELMYHTNSIIRFFTTKLEERLFSLNLLNNSFGGVLRG